MFIENKILITWDHYLHKNNLLFNVYFTFITIVKIQTFQLKALFSVLSENKIKQLDESLN